MKKNEITPEIKAMLAAAPEFTEEEAGVKPGRLVATGFAQFKEYINRNGRPKLADPTEAVTIRLPVSFANEVRKTAGKGWRMEIARRAVANGGSAGVSGTTCANSAKG